MNPADPTNVERAVSRTLRDSLERMQRNAKELDQAVADFVAACASNRPANALPSMLRAQTASASLAASLEVLSRFVTSALQSQSPAFAEPVELASTATVEAPEQVEAPEHVEAPEQLAIPAVATEPAAVSIEAPAWPAAPEPIEWSEAHESQDSPVSAASFEPEVEAPAVQEQDIQVSEVQYAEPPGPVSQESESLTLEPPPDAALEPEVESALSPEISAKPDAVEPVAAWTAPEALEDPLPVDAAFDEPVAEAVEAGEAAADEVAAQEVTTDGIVEDEEPVPTPEAAEATLAEESKIIEAAIADGIAKMSELDAAALAATRLEAEPAHAVASFDISLLPEDERELHRRASRVAKVSMQDIKLLQPQMVAIGRENKDICIRLHEEIERAHKEYGRRFKPIMDHPVDYFYDWMVEILAAGDPTALGEYPYQTPALRR